MGTLTNSYNLCRKQFKSHINLLGQYLPLLDLHSIESLHICSKSHSRMFGAAWLTMAKEKRKKRKKLEHSSTRKQI